MGKRGPKPKDKRLDDLDGNPGKRPAKPDPVKASGAPTPPSWLDIYGGKVWRMVMGSMPPNFYASVDTVVLAAYCQAASMIREASLDIKKSGITIRNNQGNKVKNPSCGVLIESLSKVATLGTRLGLDPSARQAMGIYAGGGAGDGQKPATAFGDLIAIPGGKSSA